MRSTRTLTALAVAAVLVAGCGRGGSDEASEEGTGTPPAATSADFGDLKGVCRPGDPVGAPAQGVSAQEIRVGTFTDIGFTKKSEFVDAAKVFTAWCNDAGGINGRKLVSNTRDAKLTETRQRMIEACRDDFALVGGGASMDGAGTKERLSCLLPDFPAQVVAPENAGSDLQAMASPGGYSYFLYAGFYNWLLKEAYPGSAATVGVINGDTPATKIIGQKTEEGVKAAGGTVVYNDLYPVQGVADWTPYAQSIKSKNVRAWSSTASTRNSPSWNRR